MAKGKKKSKATGKASTDRIVFPPYGYMNATYMWDVKTRRVPTQFMVHGRPGTDQEWTDTVAELVGELAAFLWPQYNRTTRLWNGAAQSHSRELTEADLSLLRDPLMDELDKPARDTDFTHKKMFEDEDDPKPPAPYPPLDSYFPDAPADLAPAVRDALMKSLGGFGPAPLRFKELLQRPRPYQMAFWLDHPGAEYPLQLAASSMTPSILSGHALQALIGGCGSYLATRSKLRNYKDGVLRLQQYCADFGDRRVFAGVHYPSDNIASWYCALRLCDSLYGHVADDAKTFMSHSIRESTVFKTLVSASRKHAVYEEPLRRLKGLMR